MARRFLILGLAMLMAVLAGCGGGGSTTAAGGGTEVPAKLTVGFAPSTEAGKISTKVEPLKNFLAKELGIPVDVHVPTDYIGLAEAMGSKKVDVGFLNTAAYALASDEFGVKVVLKSVRHQNPADTKTPRMTTYNAQIIAHKDAGIQTTKDLQNKKMAWTDPASTSGYLYPVNYLMNTDGVKDLNGFFNKQQFLIGHDAVAKAVYNKDFDAGACFDDCRTRIAKENPDVMEKVVVVKKVEGIPNDTISVRKDLSAAFVAKVKAAFEKYARSEEGKQVFFDLYQWADVADAKHEDYKAVFDVVQATKLNLREAMTPKKK